MTELDEILKTIEELRTKLNKLSKGRSLTDPDVLLVSQMLDALLNEYQARLSDKTNRS
ncbi:MAG: aspartyl-phosphate phosphatase Spo0E family protein [Veillonellales bacterium]